ncbi:hypothetical protein AMELA_G00242320 [Ameiurus melas]|uniref:Ubiquitin-like domain-containing protein n=1 Tax=Ameiurus melas TaxID=219545 RepID=A0A7J5ZXP8_AMEME|nr:hypothetical protein AMELA_G00242320 [Ameiurus melas]
MWGGAIPLYYESQCAAEDCLDLYPLLEDAQREILLRDKHHLFRRSLRSGYDGAQHQTPEWRNTKRLDQDQKTVRDYGLSSGSTVMLLICTTPAPLQVFVRNEKGQTKTYDVTEDETVDQLMRKIYQKEGTPVDQQRLIYNGRQLDSGRKLQDYNIVSGSTIHMTLRLRGG